jgi:adenylate cyclase class 2
VWADVVDGEILIALPKDGNQLAAYLDRPGFARGQFTDPADRPKLRHDSSFLQETCPPNFGCRRRRKPLWTIPILPGIILSVSVAFRTVLRKGRTDVKKGLPPALDGSVGLSMLEVEMKFPVADFAPLEGQLTRLGARAAETLQEADHYFNAPDRDFARTDEALRLRRVGPANRITYKGPRHDTQTKTRREIEIPLAEGTAAAEGFIQLLTHLGYRPVAVVRKLRRTFQLNWDGLTVEACLDEVQGVGHFVELEVLVPEDSLKAAQTGLLSLAAALNLAASERRSYLEMLLVAQEAKTP